MLLPHDSIILITDGARMLLLRNRGTPHAPDLEVIEHRQCESMPNRDIQSDAPGATFSSGSPARSRYEASDAHTREEEKFLIAAAQTLAKAANGDNGGIIVAAAPSALGKLRNAYSPEIKEQLIAERSKDYTNMPIDEITRHLVAS